MCTIFSSDDMDSATPQEFTEIKQRVIHQQLRQPTQGWKIVAPSEQSSKREKWDKNARAKEPKAAGENSCFCRPLHCSPDIEMTLDIGCRF